MRHNTQSQSQSKPKEIQLEKRYLYLPMICRVDMKRDKPPNEAKPILEQVSDRDRIISETKQSLHTMKKSLMKQLLIENKTIPFTWKVKANFTNYAQEALSDEYVLQRYTQHIKDYAEKKSYDRRVLNQRIRSEINNTVLIGKEKEMAVKMFHFRKKMQLMSITNQNMLKEVMKEKKKKKVKSVNKYYDNDNDDNETMGNKVNYNKQSINAETRDSFLITQSINKNTKIEAFKSNYSNNKGRLMKSLSSPDLQ